MGKEWRFTQLGGARKVLRLNGSAAPHGRPRREPIVSDGIKLRRQRVYYPDRKGPPTTHIFGTEWKDWTLKGRFMDRDMGVGGSKQAIRDWQAFVADAQEVEISWGDVLTVRGIVDEFTPGRESEAECSYEITVLVDYQNIETTAARVYNSRAATDIAEELTAELSTGAAALTKLKGVGDIKPSFLESLEDTVGNLNSLSASLLRAAYDIDALATGTLDQFERLRAGIAQMRTAVNVFRGTFETTANSAAITARTSVSDVTWFAQRGVQEISTLRMLELLEELEREADLSVRGSVLTTYVARAGDTWESISTQFFGGPDSAGDIRSANGVRFGEIPFSGRTYQIPLVATA